MRRQNNEIKMVILNKCSVLITGIEKRAKYRSINLTKKQQVRPMR